MKLVSGELAASVDRKEALAAYVAFARTCLSAGVRLDVLTEENRFAELTQIFRRLPLTTERLGTDAAPEIDRWSQRYSADVVVGTIESFAQDYMYESLHATEPDAAIGGRHCLLLDGGDILFRPSGRRQVIITADGYGLVDRLFCFDFVRLYRQVSGTCSIAPTRETVYGCQRARVKIRRNGEQLPEIQLSRAEHVRDEASAIESRQRAVLTDERAEMIRLSQTMVGLDQLLVRFLETSGGVKRGQRARNIAMEALGFEGQTYRGVEANGRIRSVRDAVEQLASGMGTATLCARACQAARTWPGRYWPQHLSDLDALNEAYRKKRDIPKFDSYVRDAHTLFAGLRADILASWAADVLGG